MELELWFDPGCPWCWNTSRWLNEVVAERADVQVAWRSFSLDIKNADVELPEAIRSSVQGTRRQLRVVEQARAEGMADRVGDLYTELGRRIHHEGEVEVDIEAALVAVGLPTELAHAADNAALDATIETSMREALDLAGDDTGVPILSFPASDGGRAGFFGPIITEVPVGDQALQLFESIRTAATLASFTELKRARTSGPSLPAHP